MAPNHAFHSMTFADRAYLGEFVSFFSQFFAKAWTQRLQYQPCHVLPVLFLKGPSPFRRPPPPSSLLFFLPNDLLLSNLELVAHKGPPLTARGTMMAALLALIAGCADPSVLFPRQALFIQLFVLSGPASLLLRV
jgi:hypothetical protein